MSTGTITVTRLIDPRCLGDHMLHLHAVSGPESARLPDNAISALQRYSFTVTQKNLVNANKSQIFDTIIKWIFIDVFDNVLRPRIFAMK